MKAVVTGATGFIGSVLCRELHTRGWDIRALVLPGEDYAHIASQIEEAVTGNIMQPESLADLAEGADVVFHYEAGMACIARHITKTILPELTGETSA